jgi:HEAT repeat protein
MGKKKKLGFWERRRLTKELTSVSNRVPSALGYLYFSHDAKDPEHKEKYEKYLTVAHECGFEMLLRTSEVINQFPEEWLENPNFPKRLKLRCLCAIGLAEMATNDNLPILLSSLDHMDKEIAEDVLKRIRNDEVNKFMVGLLLSDSTHLQKIACDVLIEIGVQTTTNIDIRKEAIAPLIENLTKDKVSIRRATIIALSYSDDSQVVEPLITCLKDEDAYVRKAASQALAHLHWKPDEKNQQMLLLLAGQKWENLAKLGYDAVPILIEALEDKDQEIRKGAIISLGKIEDSRAVKPLMRILDQGLAWATDLTGRKEATLALGQIGDAHAVERLIITLREDKDIYVKANAAKALGMIGDERAVNPLIATLNQGVYSGSDPNTFNATLSPVHKSAVAALSKIGDDRAIIPIGKMVQNNRIEPPVRCIAAEALGTFGNKEAIPILESVLTDKFKNVREAATKAIQQIQAAS